MKLPTDDALRMTFGFLLLAILAALTAAIALGRVEEKTSYGLMPLLTTLSTIGGMFEQWAFGGKRGNDKDDKQ